MNLKDHTNQILAHETSLGCGLQVTESNYTNILFDVWLAKSCVIELQIQLTQRKSLIDS